MRKRELGYCECTLSSDGAWHLPRSEFTKVRAAWLKGARFVDTVDFYGSPLTIMLSTVESVADYAPERLADARQDKQQNEVDDSVQSA
jgi:aryl-alcohol dehydrogenase-like predicted oxidoreductase